MNISRRVKNYFLRGLAVLLPTVLTLWVLAWGYAFVQRNVSVHINRGLVWLIQRAQGSEGLAKTDLDRILVEGTAGSVIGFLIALAIVLLVGALLASVLGRVLWRLVETLIMGTPILRGIYPHVKQVTDLVLTPEEKKKTFLRVVAVEYPRRGLWSIGFVTGSGLRAVGERAEREILTVLVPKSPALVSGYVIVVPQEETIALDMTLEEAFRFLISAGVILPEGEQEVPLPRGCEVA